MPIRLIEDELEERGIIFSVRLIEVENAVIVFFTEGRETKLGTLATALPIRFEGTSSSILLGEKFVITTRALAEHLATFFNKIVLVSTYINTLSELEAGATLMKMVRRIQEKARKE